MIRTILCPVDLTELSPCAVRLAGALAGRLGARVVLHHNIEAAPPSPLGVTWMWSEDHEREAEEQADRAAKGLEALLSELSGVEAEGKLTRGPLDEAVHEVAREVGAQLLVIATHGADSPAHDSMTQRIVLRAPCAVLALGDECREDLDPEALMRSDHPTPVIVPCDLSSRSLRAVTYALELAEQMPLALHLQHVLSEHRARDRHAVARARDQLRGLVPNSLETRISFHIGHGEPARGILELADEVGARFVIMPAHSQGPIRRALFGTTTLELLHASEVPVWFVPRGAGFGVNFRQRLNAAVE